MARVRGPIELRDLFGIHGEPGGVDVGKHGPRADHGNRQGREHGRQRRRDDLVARPDAEGSQRERDGVGARADAHGVGRVRGGGKLAFKRLDFRTQHEPAALDHAIDGASDLASIVARRQGQEPDLRRHVRPAAFDSSMYRARC